MNLIISYRCSFVFCWSSLVSKYSAMILHRDVLLLFPHPIIIGIMYTYESWAGVNRLHYFTDINNVCFVSFSSQIVYKLCFRHEIQRQKIFLQLLPATVNARRPYSRFLYAVRMSAFLPHRVQFLFLPVISFLFVRCSQPNLPYYKHKPNRKQ